jgi:hypothetical protein
MSFKDNLLQKIEIDQLTEKILASIGPAGSEQKLDKETMRRLLAKSSYVPRMERDLELFVADTDAELKKILVLDNELPLYRSTVDDVVLRKSPYIKEMANIRNIIKILKDSDVKISRKEDTVRAIQQECIARLDLSFTPADIDAIAREGAAALENRYAGGVTESLTLFAELLAYRSPPKAFQIRHCSIFGALREKESGEGLLGPVIIYGQIENTLRLLREPVGTNDKAGLEAYRKIAQGEEKASLEGADVFAWLRDEVLRAR